MTLPRITRHHHRATTVPRALFGAGLLLCCASLSACGPTVGAGFEQLPRGYDAPDRESAPFAPALVFVPAGAYVVGLEDGDDYSVGTWVAGSVAEWPEATGSPTLALGRVAERRPSWARLELLSAVDSMRDAALVPRALGLSESLPSLTKRLVPVIGTAQTPLVPIGTTQLMTGRERYGLLPGRPGSGRISSHLVGVTELEAIDAQTSRPRPIQGRAPQPGDLLVLLSVAPTAPLHVRIHVADGVDEPDDEVDAFARAAQRLRLPEVESVAEAGLMDHEDAMRRLAGKQEDALSIMVYRPSRAQGWYVLSQRDRVDDLPPPSPHRIGDELDDTAYDALLGHALSVRGESARALLTLEGALAKSGPEFRDAWLLWSPELVDAMHACWRLDWALEVVLGLDALVERSSGDARVAALETLVRSDRVRHESVRQERVNQLDIARRDGARLQIETIIAVVDFLRARGRANEATGWQNAAARGAGMDGDVAAFWEAWLEVRTQTGRAERVSADLQEAAFGPASSLGQRYELAVAAEVVLAELAETKTVTTELFDTVRHADELGVPALAFRLLARAAEVAAEGDHALLADRLLVEAVRFAQAARRPRQVASVLYELERYRAARGRAGLEGELAALYVDVLASADLRLWLGRRSLAAAQQATSAQAAGDALELALELFTSIGDAANTAITSLGLARHAAAMNQHERAKAWVARARTYEGIVKDASLTAFRHQVEREIAQRESFQQADKASDNATSP